MSMLVTCPNCGPREVQELRCAGETTKRPTSTPTVRELNEYVYFRRNVWGTQREWWFCRTCEDWFLAERHTYTNVVEKTWHPEPSAAQKAVDAENEAREARAARGADRPRTGPSRSHFTARRVQGFAGRHDRLRALRLRPAGLLAQLQVPPAARPRVLLGALRELPDDRRRDPERARLHDARSREGAVVKGQNYVGSLEHDLMQMTDKLGGPFTPPGFYYKTFIRPRKLWPLYEKFLRGAAGLGPLDPNGSRAGARRRRASSRRRGRDRRRPGGPRGRDRRRRRAESRSS